MMDMKKIILMITFAILVVGIGTFLLISQSGTNESKDITASQQNGSDKNNHPKEERKHKQDDTEKKNKENAEENAELDSEKFKGKIVDALKDTVSIFKNQETHVVAVGDSLTQGVGDSTGNGGYVGILDKKISQTNKRVEFENYGHRGDRSDQLLKRLDDPKVSTAISDADIVLITIGANDIMQVLKENFTNLNIEEFKDERVHYEKRLKSVFSKIQGLNPDTEIYLIGFYNPYDRYFKDIEELAIIVDEWNSAGKAITEKLDNVTYIPTKDLFDDTDEEIFAEDNFHPNDLGYQRMAKRVLEYLTKQER